MRYLLGYRGADLIANVRNAAQIETHLATYIPASQALSPFNVDGDGVVLPMTDGLMIVRRLLMPTLSPASAATITANAKRGARLDANVISAIDALKP
jgi:hypothetical protein